MSVLIVFKVLLKNLSAVATSVALADYLVIDLNTGVPVTTREIILLHYPLVSSANATYISIRKGVTFDKLGNPSQAVPQTAAMRTRYDNFRPDHQPPQLLKWEIDMTAGQASFYFDEAINGSSVQVSNNVNIIVFILFGIFIY